MKDNLISEMKLYGVTYAEIAKEVGLSRPFVREVLNGTRNSEDVVETTKTVLQKRKKTLWESLSKEFGNAAEKSSGIFNLFK